MTSILPGIYPVVKSTKPSAVPDDAFPGVVSSCSEVSEFAGVAECDFSGGVDFVDSDAVVFPVGDF
jgi:hypothetical protein